MTVILYVIIFILSVGMLFMCWELVKLGKEERKAQNESEVMKNEMRESLNTGDRVTDINNSLDLLHNGKKC